MLRILSNLCPTKEKDIIKIVQHNHHYNGTTIDKAK
jgi:hypothetical protein